MLEERLLHLHHEGVRAPPTPQKCCWEKSPHRPAGKRLINTSNPDGSSSELPLNDTPEELAEGEINWSSGERRRRREGGGEELKDGMKNKAEANRRTRREGKQSPLQSQGHSKETWWTVQDNNVRIISRFCSVHSSEPPVHLLQLAQVEVDQKVSSEAVQHGS